MSESVDPAGLAADARVWLKIGCLSFGGPAGQIALMQRLLVDELRWIGSARFLAGLDLCMLLPGPEAQQLATYVGWTRHGWRGGVVAGGLFVLPGALVMLALSWSYVRWGALPPVAALFAGLQCAVVAIVAQALFRLGRRALGSFAALALALAAFAAVALFRLPFPLVVLGAATAGLFLPQAPAAATPTAAEPDRAATRRSALAPAWVAAALWLLPLALLVATLGPDSLLVRIALRYSELAVVSFGGAYALLAALAERAVGEGWLSAAAMADGLALAESTPGPLILVLEFVAFVAAHAAGGASPFATGLAASAVALWALFLPSFVWIFLAAPHLERVERSPRLRRAVRGVTAAVVGVILHLALWLALHVLFGEVERRRWGALDVALPRLESLDPWALVVTAVAAVMLFALRQSLGRALAVAAALGLARGLFGW